MAVPPDVAAEAGDASVIERSWHEPERFGAIFDTYFAEIHRYVARRLDVHIADDIAAETFHIAFRRRRTYDLTRGNARPWLYGIATNLIGRHRRDEVRKFRALKRMPVDTGGADGHDERVAARVSAQQEVRGPLAEAVAGLPAKQRDVVLLMVLAELSYEEVAQALDVPFGTVCSRFNRARRKLREALGGTNPLGDEERTR
ncbi:RNA polymerase sigma factor [Actinomadura rubrisoli]|uniref:RNA polymerase sigma factor n=1 Tax=Actinomadura rubrisoli TaxID=2530368 RepID=A0A4R5B9T1_9ACTN|nr:RNA polymerase sigma factor [Actinomadura rubrisoli]TDD80474.1 RNA polymerase sigma factor [Actinomadura rubrisoli]